MNYMEIYLNKIFKTSLRYNIDDYKMKLDKKLKDIEEYIAYLSEKRMQLKKLIDSISLALENKYIDIADLYNIRCAEEVHDNEIASLRNNLNQIEAYCAQIETKISEQAKEKMTIEKECHLIHYMSAVA